MNEINPGNGALMSFIERAAKDPEFDVQKFGELLRLQRDVGHDQSRRAFNAAMAEAQAAMPPVVRSATNQHLKNKYAKLEDLDREMRPVYTAHGFSVRFGSAPAPGEGKIRITCTVAHAGGYFEENYLDAPVDAGGRSATTPVQAVGSAVTYLRRYLLGMVFNIVLADDDDDGEFQRRPPAAAATPRAPRITEKVEAPQRTDEQWRVWVDKLRQACAVLYSRQEVVEIGGRISVGDAIRDAPPKWRREIDAILDEAYKRFPEEPEPEVEPLPDLEIHGADKLAG